jgi:hypothetical protein
MGPPNLFPPLNQPLLRKRHRPFPAYPAYPNSNLLAADFENRKCIEISSTDLQIGPFPATDFYGDGSPYILDTPGHWPGHICTLARTTSDTFVYLGGDMCHFPGHFRPSEDIPLPDTIPSSALLHSTKYPMPCPCEFFSDHHPQLHNDAVPTSSVDPRKPPFYQLSTAHHSTYYTKTPQPLSSQQKR